MGATIHHEESGIWVVRFSGALHKKEMDEIQSAGLRELAPGEEVKLLAVVEENFSGWVGEGVWNDMSFFVKHGDRIAKIAIVGDELWEERMLMFVGAGFRRAPVRYFPRKRLASAYAWLHAKEST